MNEHEWNCLVAADRIAQQAAYELGAMCRANRVLPEDARQEAMIGILGACAVMREDASAGERYRLAQLRARTAVVHLCVREKRHAQLEFTLDDPIGEEDDGSTLLDFVPADHADLGEAHDAIRVLDLALSIPRTPIEDQILSRRLLSDEPATRPEIAADWDRTAEWVRLREVALIEKIRIAA